MSTGPLVSLARQGFVEVEMHGEIVVSDDRKVLFSTSEAIGEYPARSILKPFQLLATGMVEKERELSQKVVAACGSTSGTSQQIETLKEWHENSPDFPLLKIPTTAPWSHACLSKHLMILEGCRKNQWDPKTYTSVDHPYQAKLKSILESLIGEGNDQWEWVTDGCHLPSPVLSLRRLALLYHRLAMMSGEIGAIREGMLRNPEWVGGPNRKDTELMIMNAGQLIAKEGADGLLALSVLPTKSFPSGLGIIVKLTSGYLPNLAILAVAPVLQKLGLKVNAQVPEGQEAVYGYRAFESSPSRIVDISPALSPKTAVWPGDTPFRRTVSMDTTKGQHITLSAVETTLHIGAHTDSPNHFEKVRDSIGDVPLEKYLGPCQIIEVKKGPKETIKASDIEGVEILSRRVIFKTGSFPNPNHYNMDFVSLSASAIEHLAKYGVVLVGIDTPSIDLADSKDLPAHHATTKAGMSILEGIILKGVEPGIYELMAAPLKIEGGDASPVRAVLRRLC